MSRQGCPPKAESSIRRWYRFRRSILLSDRSHGPRLVSCVPRGKHGTPSLPGYGLSGKPTTDSSSIAGASAMRVTLPFLCLGVVAASCLASAATNLPALKAERWVNTGPLTAETLRGKVVLIDFEGHWRDRSSLHGRRGEPGYATGLIGKCGRNGNTRWKTGWRRAWSRRRHRRGGALRSVRNDSPGRRSTEAPARADAVLERRGTTRVCVHLRPLMNTRALSFPIGLAQIRNRRWRKSRCGVRCPRRRTQLEAALRGRLSEGLPSW